MFKSLVNRTLYLIIDILHIHDATSTIVAACITPLPSCQKITVNIGSGKPVSILEFASLCQEAAKNSGLAEPPLDILDNGQPSKLLRWGIWISETQKKLLWM